jgi:hypothetical protein
LGFLHHLFLGFKIEENSAEEAMMEINGGEVIEVAKALSKPLSPAALSKPLSPTSSSSPAAGAGRPNPDLAEADSQLAEQENGPDGMADIANDDQDPGGEVKDDENQVFLTKFFLP